MYKPSDNDTSWFEYARCTVCHPSCIQCHGGRSIDCDQCVVGYGWRNGDGQECVRRLHHGHYINNYKQTGNLTVRQGGQAYPSTSAKIGAIGNGQFGTLATVAVVGLVILVLIALAAVYYQCYLLTRPQAKCDRRIYEVDLTAQGIVALGEYSEAYQHLRRPCTPLAPLVHESTF